VRYPYRLQAHTRSRRFHYLRGQTPYLACQPRELESMANKSIKSPKLPSGYFWRGHWIWCRTDPATKEQVSTKCKDVKALKEWTAERERIANDPHYAAARAARLDIWISKTIESKVKSKTDENEKAVIRGFYTTKLGHFARLWGVDLPLFDVTPDRCDQYWETRKSEGTGDNTVCKEFSCLTQMLKLARHGGCYQHDIEALRPLNLAPHYVPRTRHLTLDQLRKLFSECSSKMAAFVIVAICTGGRKSEVLKFTAADLSEQLAHLKGTKTEGSNRTIPILEPFQRLLAQALPSLPIAYKNNLRRDLLATCKRAGIDPVTPNDLRRTFSSLLISAGVPRDVVRRLLGHTSNAMVDKVYGQIAPHELAALAKPALAKLPPLQQFPQQFWRPCTETSVFLRAR